MVLTLYLAMTAAEMYQCSRLPENMAFMACHFSPYGKGLSNIPPWLPPESVLILNDRIPPCGHDPEAVAEQLATAAEELTVSRVLLDLQRPKDPETAKIVKAIGAALPCPLAVTAAYAEETGCAVFLSPKLRQPLAEQLAPWAGRDIWLEATLDCEIITVTEDGSDIRSGAVPDSPPVVHTDEDLFCRYFLELEDRAARFTVWRDRELLEAFLQAAGVSCAVGLYQQLKK